MSRPFTNDLARRFPYRACLVCLAWVLSAGSMPSLASDHADPIDPFNREALEGGITDLFVFPVNANGEPVLPTKVNQALSLADPLADSAREETTSQERAQIDALVVVLCVRRALTQTGSLKLAPYTYRIHFDLDSRFEQVQKDSTDQHTHNETGEAGYGHTHAPTNSPKRPTPHEAFLRYGGSIEKPDLIGEEVTVEFRLDNHAQLQNGYPAYLDEKGEPIKSWQESNEIAVKTGVFEDPFIFPAFFGTNVVAMVMRVPMKLFPKDQSDFLIWATSHIGGRQVDHQGRSLRTQNPRFELLNTLHPRDHVQAIVAEHEDPSLMRDIFLRFNFAQTFAYRRWDFVPDVMIFSTKHRVGFPNGRLLTDDVASILAQSGDTLLYELAYQHNNDGWPKRRVNDSNDGRFLATFPYLLPPFDDKPPPAPLRLSNKNRWKLAGVFVGLVVLFGLENWLVARWYCSRQRRRRHPDAI